MAADRGGLRAPALFSLAPFVGEYVLGNQALTALPSLLLLVPLYGGGAVLIREVGRRTREAWPVMGFLAVACALGSSWAASGWAPCRPSTSASSTRGGSSPSPPRPCWRWWRPLSCGRGGPSRSSGARRPLHAGLGAFAVTTGFWLVDLVEGGWVATGGGAVVLLLGLTLLVRESRHPGWGPAHHLAAATGALATYLWLAPVNTAQLGATPVIALACRARRTTLGT